MLRFPCPVCGKSLKVPEEATGKSVRCPRCRERTTVRPDVPAAAATLRADDAHHDPGWFSGMSPTLRQGVIALVLVGLLSLSLAVVRPFLPGEAWGWMTHAGLLGTAGAFVLLCATVYGHVTGCPHCGRWYTRIKGSTEFVDREVLDRGESAVARSQYRINYECRSCGRTWSVVDTDEYRVTQNQR
jgi:DNA-directed RNA polymerase subunit RPC12/RpoP